MSQAMLDLLWRSFWETIIMTGFSSLISLAVGLPVAEERALAHRHLDFYVDGLCVADATPGSVS